MKMRELEAATGVNRETIRGFFRAGLLPEANRPKRNVADYDETHVEAILAVRDLQKRSGLTLQQISDMVNDRKSPGTLDNHGFMRLQTLVANRIKFDNSGHVYLAALAEKYPDIPGDAALMAHMRMISITDTEDGPTVSTTDARILQIWQHMRAAGFTEENGFTPDITEYYRTAAEYVATNDAYLFRDRTESHVDEEKAVDMLEHALPLMLELFGLLRTKSFIAQMGPEFRHRRPDQGNTG